MAEVLLHHVGLAVVAVVAGGKLGLELADPVGVLVGLLLRAAALELLLLESLRRLAGGGKLGVGGFELFARAGEIAVARFVALRLLLLESLRRLSGGGELGVGGF